MEQVQQQRETVHNQQVKVPSMVVILEVTMLDYPTVQRNMEQEQQVRF